MDENGIIIATDILILPKNVEQTIDISSLPSGVYFIILNIDERYFKGKRDFVLMPLAEIAPDTVHPTLNNNIAGLLAEIRK